MIRACPVMNFNLPIKMPTNLPIHRIKKITNLSLLYYLFISLRSSHPLHLVKVIWLRNSNVIKIIFNCFSIAIQSRFEYNKWIRWKLIIFVTRFFSCDLTACSDQFPYENMMYCDCKCPLYLWRIKHTIFGGYL